MPEDMFGKTTCRALIALCSDHLELGHQLIAGTEPDGGEYVGEWQDDKPWSGTFTTKMGMCNSPFQMVLSNKGSMGIKKAWQKGFSL